MATSSSVFLPEFPRFSLNEDEMHSVGVRWKKYMSRFNNFLVALNINTEARKRALLLHYGGFSLQDIYESLDNTGTILAELNTAFTTYFEPKTNECFETWNFQKTVQNEGESLQTYYLKLNEIASRCNFTDVNKNIKTQLILGTTSQKLRKYCFSNKEVTLQNILVRGKLYEDVEFQSKEIESNDHAEPIIKEEDVQALRNQVADLQFQVNERSGKSSFNNPKVSPKRSCYNCGNEWPHVTTPCPARNKVCRSCEKLHHFARVCRSRHTTQPQRNSGLRQNSSSSVNNIESQNFQVNATSNEQQQFLFSMGQTHTVKSSDKLIKFRRNIKISGKFIPVLIDTGCSTNVINFQTFQYLQKFKKHDLKKSNVCLVPYGASAKNTTLKSLGIINCLAESNTRFAYNEFFVVNTNSPNLIGGNLAIQLGLLSINVQQVNKITSVSKPSHDNASFKTCLTKVPTRLRTNIQHFQNVFTGTGKLKCEQIKLHINKYVKPVAQKPRRIPFHLRQKVDLELKKLREADIIEDITEEATPWVSPIVVVPKNSGEIRMCIDMRQANKAIERTRHPSPCIEDLVHDLNGASHFCKLDMNNAFLQLELEPDSRYITTFATHQGLHRFKRLNFGTSSASEELQIKLEKILRNIKGCKNIADDIILFANQLNRIG